MGKYAVDVVTGNVFNRLRVIVKRGNHREDGGPGLGYGGHVAQVDQVQGRLADAQHQAAALLQADIGGAFDQVPGRAVRDSGQRAHRAGEHDHSSGRVGAAGDGGSDVLMFQQMDLAGAIAGEEQPVEQAAAAGTAGLLGQHAQGAGGDHELDALDARVVFQGAEQLHGEDGAAGAGHGHNQGPAARLARGRGLRFGQRVGHRDHA